MEFTQEQQDHINKMKEKWIVDELNPLKTKITTLESTVETHVKELNQYKSTQKTEQELKIDEKLKELWNKEKSLTLKEHGLDKFADFIHADSVENLTKSIDAFKNVMKELNIDNSFIPNDRKSQANAYSQAKKNNDTVGMIKALFTG